MMSTPKFLATGLRVRLTVWNSVLHSIAFVQFVEQHKSSLFLRDRVVNPDFPRRHELIYVVVPPSREIDIEDTAHESTIYNPHVDAILQFLPEAFMCSTAIRELLSPVRCLCDVTGMATLLALRRICFDESLVVRHSFGHQLVLYKKMVYEKLSFIMFRFLVYPEFVLGNVLVPIVLPEVCELLIDVSADITAIHDPHLNVSSFVNLTQVGMFQ
jgi:hypothetical protein